MVEFKADHTVTTPEGIPDPFSLDNRGKWKNAGTWKQNENAYSWTTSQSTVNQMKLSDDCKQLFLRNEISGEYFPIGSRYPEPAMPVLDQNRTRDTPELETIHPSAADQAPFTLQPEQGVEVDTQGAGEVRIMRQTAPGTEIYRGSPSHAGSSSITGSEGENYQKGGLLAGPISLPAIKNSATDILYLDLGRPYIVIGEGICSLWSDHTDGVDSCFCYAEWRCPNELQAWGLLELTNPSAHLSDLINKDGKGNPVYRSSHVYEAAIVGEGKMLQARVYDGGGYDDNNGELKISIYEAIPMQEASVPAANGGSENFSTDGSNTHGPGEQFPPAVPDDADYVPGGSEGIQSGGCYQDPLTGEIICVDENGDPEGQDSSLQGGCYTDPYTGEITCVDVDGNPIGA